MSKFIGDSDKMQLDYISDEEIIKNLCIICKVDMGANNPRQLCRKTYCENEAGIKLCENMDCERFPPDWDSEEDTEETYREGQWKKCCLCDGYFDDDGLGDILFIEEEPNNQRAGCNLCGKDRNIVQMKGSGQYICEAACDESDEESDEESEENEVKELELIKPENSVSEERYVVCDNCEESIDCWNTNIYCLYKGDQKNPSEEITICTTCNDDLSEDFKQDGYNCDDWDESDEEDYNCIFNYYICKYCEYVTTNDDPHCSKCKKEMCMELFQAESQSEALNERNTRNN